MSVNFSLAAVFGDHMVLQRDRPLVFWGRGRPGDTVRLDWATAQATISAETCVDAGGSWRLSVSAQPAGGPHELMFRGPEPVTLHDVWVGEVWLASGQSNMEWTVAQAAFADDEIALATEPRIRWLFVERRTAREPASDAHCSWRAVTPSTVARMTAVGFAFARQLFAKLNVAIGIIDASWGGTPVEAWSSAEALRNVMDLDAELRVWDAEEREIDAVRRAYGETLRSWEQQHLVRDDGNRGEAAGWHQTDQGWNGKTLPVPTIWQRHGMPFNGAVWFRREIELPADWAAPATLHLGRIDDFDHTYVNGVLVGACPQGTPLSCDIARRYALPPGLLRPGRNSICVRIFDHAGDGGFLDPASSLFLEAAGGARIELAGDWQYRVEREVPLVPGSVWAHYPHAPRVLRPQEYPAGLYNGMIAPLLPFAVRGVIWYQGEANVAEHAVYLERFSAMIRDWQSRFGAGSSSPNGAVSFHFVQLASFRASLDWAHLREAQAQALRVPHTGMVVTLDIGDPNDIHPRNKREVGRRLALLALKQTYGLESGPVRGPIPSRVRSSGREIVVDYAEPAELATSDGRSEVCGFELETSDGQLHEVSARLVDDQVRVASPSAGTPRRLFYAFRDAPAVNLINSAGLPAEPFRLPIEAVPGEAGVA